jgi:phosphotransferase system enzyme I (PtsI)
MVLVDGATGEIEVAPDHADATSRVEAAAAAKAALESWTGPARTADGTRVKVLANVADGQSARAAADGPVDGVGLFRTELCFLNRKDEPSVAEQTEIYAEVLSAFGPERTVVVRTLDAGSDKPIAFATLEGEENPALGVRGLRLSFGNPGLLERQLYAIASAARMTSTSPWVMAPMVATVAEAADFAEQVRSHGLKAGVMVEIPSAALQAHKMLEHVDFLSIGTNDLTQYTMAADRMASGLAHLTDAWQPAVLALIAISAEAGKQAGKPVGVCGEAAADPSLAAAMVGMGVTSLSMASAAVRTVGAQLAAVSMDVCEHAAEAALAASDPMAAREAVRRVLDSA